MSTIKFRLAAKTDVGLVRTNNEDNFQMATDLSSSQMRWVNNEICSLGDKGALLVVADGMGGMNAGEVASALAIETVREYFASERLTQEVVKNRYSIEKYMNEVIIAADARIKKAAKEHPETRGMGTTIVIGWILNGKFYVSWCGDSRAYIYNSEAGLHQITKDHSYVQSLVDKGSISKEDAFDYPDSNIITRSLSDGGTKAKPDSLLKPYDLCDHDIILFCTDGLNGMIRDNEIEAVIRNNEHDMDELADRLICAACEAEGSDNITLCICQILQGGGVCDPSVFEESDKRLDGSRSQKANTIVGKHEKLESHLGKKILIGLSICMVITAVAFGIWYFISHYGEKKEPDQNQKSVPTESKKENNDPDQESGRQKDQGKDLANRNVDENTATVVSAQESDTISILNSKSLVTILSGKSSDSLTLVTNDPGLQTDSNKVQIDSTYIIQTGDNSWRIVAKSIKNATGISFSEEKLQAENADIDFIKGVKAGQKIKLPQITGKEVNNK